MNKKKIDLVKEKEIKSINIQLKDKDKKSQTFWFSQEKLI